MDEIVVGPKANCRDLIKELWTYRELFVFFSWRNIVALYKQTVIGIAWSFIKPALTVMVFSLVFGKIAKLPSEGVPYPLLVCAGFLPWQFFSGVISTSADVLINDSNLIKKIYFPRIIMPTTLGMLCFMDLIFSMAFIFALMVFYRFSPDLKMIFLPFFILLMLLLSLGCAYLISALTVRYRDVRFVIPFVLQIGLYLSPVGFSSAAVPGPLRIFYALNPLAGIIDGFRWSLLGPQVGLYFPGFCFSVFFSLAIFLGGAFFFLRSQHDFADYI